MEGFMKEKIGTVLRFIIKVLRALLCAVGGCFHRHKKAADEDASADDDDSDAEINNK